MCGQPSLVGNIPKHGTVSQWRTLLKLQLGYQQLQRVWPPRIQAKTQVLHDIPNLNYTVQEKIKETGGVGLGGRDANLG